jgi:hypothetical protein
VVCEQQKQKKKTEDPRMSRVLFLVNKNSLRKETVFFFKKIKGVIGITKHFYI